LVTNRIDVYDYRILVNERAIAKNDASNKIAHSNLAAWIKSVDVNGSSRWTGSHPSIDLREAKIEETDVTPR
jgi:hypothetical protein